MNRPLRRAGATKMRRMRRLATRLATVMCGKDHLLVATDRVAVLERREGSWSGHPKGDTWLWSGKGTQIKKQFKISTEMNMRNLFFFQHLLSLSKQNRTPFDRQEGDVEEEDDPVPKPRNCGGGAASSDRAI